MARQKGSAKYGGRVKGTPNRTSEDVRQSLLKLLDDNLIQLQKDIKSMKDKDRANLLISLAKHCTPPAVNPERLTEDQLIQILEYLKSKENEKDNN